MKSSTFGLNPKSITQLLRIGSKQNRDKTPKSSVGAKADLLHQWLNQCLPAEALPTRTSHGADGRDVDDMLLDKWTHLTIGRLLEAKTNLEMVVALKDYAKAQVASAQIEAERDVAMAVYYASIANARVYHGQMITSHSHSHLSRAFSMLSQKKWLADMLKDLYNSAVSTMGK